LMGELRKDNTDISFKIGSLPGAYRQLLGHTRR
jgi:hypothetical protein